MSSSRSGQTGAGFSQSFVLVLVIVAALLIGMTLLAVFAWQPWGGEVASDREGAPGAEQAETPTPQSYQTGAHFEARDLILDLTPRTLGRSG